MTLTRYAAAWCARLTLFVTVSVTSRPVSPKPHLHCTSKSPKAAAACRARIVREQQQVENMCMQEHGKDTKRQTHNKTRQESGLCAARIEEGYMQTGRSTPDSETETQNTYCAALRRAKKAQHALMCCRIDRLNTQNTQQSQATTQRTCDAVKWSRQDTRRNRYACSSFGFNNTPFCCSCCSGFGGCAGTPLKFQWEAEQDQITGTYSIAFVHCSLLPHILILQQTKHHCPQLSSLLSHTHTRFALLTFSSSSTLSVGPTQIQRKKTVSTIPIVGTSTPYTHKHYALLLCLHILTSHYPFWMLKECAVLTYPLSVFEAYWDLLRWTWG